MWWWDGTGWVPAFSADGRRWFDGIAWREVEPSWLRKLWLAAIACLALGALALVPVFGYGAGEPSGSPIPRKEPHSVAVTMYWLAFVAISALLFLFTTTKRRRYARAPSRPPGSDGS